jgi:hypothetical protein
MNDVNAIKNDLLGIILMMEVRKAAISALAHGGVISGDSSNGITVDCGCADGDLVGRRIAKDVKDVVVAKISDKILRVSRVGRR